MGTSRANEMLLLGKTLNAQEAEQCGFVAKAFEPEVFMSEVLKRAKEMASLPREALQQTKALYRDRQKKTYHEVNNTELELLVHRFMSDEAAQAMMKFMMEKKNKKSKSML